MELLIISFFAGILTVAAPCILPLLPVIVGGSTLHVQEGAKKPSLLHPLVISVSLAISIILFTLLLKATTLLLGIPTEVWSVIAGLIVIFFGVNLLFPSIWDRLMIATNLQAKTNQLIGKSQSSRGIKRDILLGASLGPVFNSCSPTYALIVAVVLPSSFLVGFGYLTAYAVGVALVLLLIGLFGGAIALKLRWLANPNGWFKKTIGILFIVVGLTVLFGFDRKIQTYVLEQGWYDPILRIEEGFRH